MQPIENLVEELLSGSGCPISLRIGGKAGQLRFQRARELEGVHHLSYQAASEPLQVSLEVRFDAHLRLLRYQATVNVLGRLSGRLSAVHLMRLHLPITAGDDPATVLRSFNGGAATVDHSCPTHMFAMQDHRLQGLDILQQQADTGRGSNEQLPIWLFGDGQSGLWFGPEWQGSWRMRCERMIKHSHVKLALHHLDCALQAAEEVRLPAMAVGGFDGDLDRGCNQVRRVIREHYQPPRPAHQQHIPLSYQMLAGDRQAFAMDDRLPTEMQRAAQLGAEYFTSPSVWQYDRQNPDRPRMWWHLMGTMQPSRDRWGDDFPAVVARLQELGLRLGLWIDPRVAKDTAQAEREADCLLHCSQPHLDDVASAYDSIGHEINLAPLIDLSRSSGRAALSDWLDISERPESRYRQPRCW